MRPTTARARTNHSPTTAGQHGVGFSLLAPPPDRAGSGTCPAINEVLAALTELRSDLKTHAWQPDEHKHDLGDSDARKPEPAPTPYASG